MISKPAIRKLTTIFVADVVGYSGLMAANEEATLDTLRTYQDVIETHVAKHSGRIFKTAGDAFLAEFGSPVEAVRCAISIQEELALRNAERSESEQLWLRIGINLGDVLVEDDDLFGDGVNIASRLEGLAAKGGICISGSTFDQVKNKLSVTFSDLGPQRVKNIPEPVTAFTVIVGTESQYQAKSAQFGKNGFIGAVPIRTAVAIGIVALAGTGFATWLLNPNDHPHDGIWKVYVHSKSECNNNDTVSFPMNVSQGVINEPDHPLPKKGEVSADGRFRIEVTRKDGAPRSTLEGTIFGDKGEGMMVGVKLGCSGRVSLERVSR